MKRAIIRIRRFFCRHRYIHVVTWAVGEVYHCDKCGAVFQSYGRLKMHYIGQREEVFDENGKPRL